MSTINQKEYLKKYLSLGNEKEKSKKRRKKAKIIKDRVKIIDDDIDIANSNNINESELKEFLTAEDAPQVVGIVDDRPLALRLDDYRKSDKWKLVGSDDEQKNIEENSASELLANAAKIKSKLQSTNSSYQLKGNYDSDQSPPRTKNDFRSLKTTSKNKYNSNSDVSPPRRSKTKSNRTDKSDSDVSPPRQKSKKYDSDVSPPRQKPKKNASDASPPTQKSKKYDSDPSPPRQKSKKYDSDVSPPRQKSKKYDSDASPPRQKSKKYDSDTSPRRRPKKYDSDATPPRQKSRKTDVSPPRQKSRKADTSPSRQKSRKADTSPPRQKSRKADTSPSRQKSRKADASPSRQKSTKYNSHVSPPRQTPIKYDSDASPPRKSRKLPDESENNSDLKQHRVRKSRFSDISPVRKNNLENDSRKHSREESSSSSKYKEKSGKDVKDDKEQRKQKEDISKKMTKTLDGKTAGLQNATDLKHETESFKKREDELFKNMSTDISGANAAPIMRDRKTGKKRNLEQEALEESEKQKKLNEQKSKYDRWGKGLKQVDDMKEKVQQELHEMNKPLARYADDEDLEKYLRNQEREGDPMLQYIRKKKRKEAVAAGNPSALKPQYDGDFLPNRFGIPPGHRWDGVDRSNGYEKSWFTVQNSKKAVEEEVYKWSTEDM